MKLEQQVVSLDLAKKLKELRVKQESYFVWYTNAGTGHLLYLGDDGMRPMEAKTYSAFTVAELGEMLPREVEFEGQFYYWESGKNDDLSNRWFYKYETAHIRLPVERLCMGVEETEADARAKMLIYLLENNLIQL